MVSGNDQFCVFRAWSCALRLCLMLIDVQPDQQVVVIALTLGGSVHGVARSIAPNEMQDLPGSLCSYRVPAASFHH